MILDLVCFSVDYHDVKQQMYIRVVLTDIMFSIIVTDGGIVWVWVWPVEKKHFIKEFQKLEIGYSLAEKNTDSCRLQ